MRQGKRGPRKGDGGRPRARLVSDDDRFAVALVFWMTKQGEEIDAALVKFCDMLTSDRNVKSEAEIVRRGRKRLSLSNTAGNDQSSEEVWRTRALAPDGLRQWRGRLAIIERKASQSRDQADTFWLAQSYVGLQGIVSPDASDHRIGRLALSYLGWPKHLVERLAGYLASRPAFEHGAIRTGDRITSLTVASCSPDSVLRVEDAFRISSRTSI